jgi:pseudouridine-5'-phosphate glycosidase
MPAADDLLVMAPAVREALDRGRAVVALESTIITHGLPRPQNLEAALRAESAVRDAGASAATVATHDGHLRVGLDRDELEQLAAAQGVPKVSRQNLAGVLTRAGWGGTTVSATMIAAALARIEVFATGGIGGVHRGGEASLDISADLDELARTPVSVVCAGPKSILDVARTLEALETRGVPVVAWRSDDVAGFYSRSSGHRATLRVDSAAEAARLIVVERQLGLSAGILLTVPLPEDVALDRDEIAAAVDQAEAEAAASGIHGPASTPFILARVAELTDGRSVRANLALIEQDARVAGEIASALAILDDGPKQRLRPS